MAELAFGVNAYRRSVGQFSETRLVNQYLEIGADKSLRLIGRPGLVSSYSVGDDPILGIYAQPGTFGGDVFIVSGGFLYRNGVSVGSLPATTRVSFAGNETQLLIATGTAMYRYDGTVIQLVAFPDDAAENSVIYFAGLFVVAVTGTQKFYWSAALDGGVWDGLAFASAERKPDNLVAVTTVGDEVWMFGENSTEFWYSTGNVDAPFSRISGRAYDKGAINRDCLAPFDNTVAWVGQNKVVYRGGPVPQRLSDYGIEERLARTDAANIHAWSFVWNGHEFYVVNTIEGAFAYDASTQQWSEFKSYGRTGWRAQIGCVVGSTIYAGDDTVGTIWTLSQDALLDGTDPIERISSSIIHHTGTPITAFSIHLDISPGQTPYTSGQGYDPQVEMRLSRDGGKTFGNWNSTGIGQQGHYRQRSAWRRIGLVDEPGIMFEFRTTDPAPWTLSGVRVNELAGGRSR